MDKLHSYKTVEKTSVAEIIEKKSRFIANVFPISNEEDAHNYIDLIKKKHYNARHNVFAYIVDINKKIPRYFDDGEPAGTAGIPILNILTNENIINTLVIVTRYFGGTLLGTGGLVRAYSLAAKNALSAAKVIEKVLYSTVEITVDYALSGKVEFETISRGSIIDNINYTENVTFTVLTPFCDTQKFIDYIKNTTNALAKINVKHTVFRTNFI